MRNQGSAAEREARRGGSGIGHVSKKAWRLGTSIVFIDETGFRWQPVNRRTRAPRGETAVQRAWNRYDRLSILGAVALSPTRRRISTSFAIHDRKNVRAAQAVAFVKHLPSPLPLAAGDVLGRWQVPRTAATRSASRRLENIHLEWLPAYAPELNPVEPRWSHTKFGKLANFVPDDTALSSDRSVPN